MRAYRFKFQIYTDHSQIYVSDVNFSPKLLTCLPMSISTQIFNNNFKLKMSKTDLPPTHLCLPHQAQPSKLASHLCLQTQQTVPVSNQQLLDEKHESHP